MRFSVGKFYISPDVSPKKTANPLKHKEITDLNITWLRNANAGAGSTFDDGDSNADGRMTWANANDWATRLTVGSYTGWRLPTMVDTGARGCDFSYSGGTECGFNVQTATSEMAHLYYVSLGNLAYCPPGDTTCAGGPQAGCHRRAGELTNLGNFYNLQPYLYWSGSAHPPYLGNAWFFSTYEGSRGYDYRQKELLAMAVRPGDVAAAQVPEPGTLLLAALALAGMGVVRRRRPLGASAF